MRRPLPQFCLSLSTDQGQGHLKLVHRGTALRGSDSVGRGQGGGENPQFCTPQEPGCTCSLHCLEGRGGVLPHFVPLRVGGPVSGPALDLGLGPPAHCPSLEAS